MTKTEEEELRQCWRTPPELWQVIKYYWNPTIDLAANKDNALCHDFLGNGGIFEDALAIENWPYVQHKTCGYCNPGFSSFTIWLGKIRMQVEQGFPCIVSMVIYDPSTEWWNTHALKASEIIALTPRVQFIPQDGIKKSSNTHANALLIHRHEPFTEKSNPRYRTLRWKEEYYNLLRNKKIQGA